MRSIADEAVDAFNEQVEVARDNAEDQEVIISLRTFSTTPDEPMLWLEPVDELEELDHEDYTPDGMTAMYDCVADTIDRLRDEVSLDEDDAHLVVIISDGLENNSQDHEADDVAERVQACEDTEQWTFAYMGANQDLADVEEHVGLLRTQDFKSTKGGMSMGGRKMARSSQSYYGSRSEGETQVSSYWDDDDDSSSSEDDE